MTQSRTPGYRLLVVVGAALAAMLIGVGQEPALATHRTVTAVKGSAYGYYLSVGLFGGPPTTSGPSPTVTLATNASNSPQTGTQPSAVGKVGPATFFASGKLDVSTQGTLGASGSVTSSSNIASVSGDQGEVFAAANVASTCTATGSGVSGSTTITNGTLQTDTGNDANGDGDFTDPGEHAPVTASIPANPAPNTSYTGHIHVNGAQDNFQYSFNEKVSNPDGSLTVYAAHERLMGPTAVGDLFIGKAECGMTSVPGSNAAPVAGDDAYTTRLNAPLTVLAPGVLGNDTDTDGGTLTAGSASDPAGGSVTLNPNGSFTYTPDAGFSGTDTFTYTVTDNHGATDTGLVTITVDAIAPDTSITEGPSGTINSASTSFSFSSTEAGSLFECKLDASAFAACSSPKSLTDLSEGPHTFSVRAIDAAGNTDASPATRSFTVDLPDPAAADADGDGVPNSADQCPSTPGVSQQSGCPSNESSFSGKALLKKGQTVLTLSVPGPGVVTAAQVGATASRVATASKLAPALVKPVRVVVGMAGKVKLTLRPSKAGQKRLRAKRSFSVEMRITYTPTGGKPRSKLTRVKIQR